MNIKKGDLVMIVKPSPCCGSLRNLGFTFAVQGIIEAPGVCVSCNRLSHGAIAFEGDMQATDLRRLKKIDPPADGDSLPTRADMGVAA